MKVDLQLRFHIIIMHAMIRLVQCHPEFGGINFSACLLNDNDVHLHGMSWSGCLQSCRRRDHCLAVSYGRAVHLCILSYGGDNKVSEVCPGFVYSEKTSWNDKGQPCDCSGILVCEAGGTDLNCISRECVVPADLTNVHIHGNTASVGSRLKSSCETGFGLPDDGERTCNEDGTWVNGAGLDINWPLCVSESPLFTSASQTSVFRGGVAELAIDGNTTHNFYDSGIYFCSHTLQGIGDMWTGNLKMVSFIRKVVIYNRGDCCLDRLNNFSVLVDSQLCIHYTSNSAPLVIHVNCESDNIFGQSVSIVQHSDTGLTLCEVQVFS